MLIYGGIAEDNASFLIVQIQRSAMIWS